MYPHYKHLHRTKHAGPETLPAQPPFSNHVGDPPYPPYDQPTIAPLRLLRSNSATGGSKKAVSETVLQLRVFVDHTLSEAYFQVTHIKEHRLVAVSIVINYEWLDVCVVLVNINTIH
jgi:hypothetical protein